MPKCPNCGAELPSPSHFGIKANPKNYIAPQIPLAPGKKYYRTFALLFYPERDDEEMGRLSPCLVIASEEHQYGGQGLPFISGSKFYEHELDKLELAVENIMAAEVAFKAFLTGRSVTSLMFAKINSMYNAMRKREQLAMTAESMLNKMRLCDEITKKEEGQ